MNNEEIVIQKWLQKFDTEIVKYENKWGVSQLETLCSPEMAIKWKRQMHKLNTAIDECDLFTMPELVEGCIRGLAALESDAINKGATIPQPENFMRVVLPKSGKELIIAVTGADASKLQASEKAVIWTLDEVAAMVESQGTLINVIDERMKGGGSMNVSGKRRLNLGQDEVPF